MRGSPALICVISWCVLKASAAQPPHALGQGEIPRLERDLNQAQDALKQGRLSQDRYAKFLVQFKPSLDMAWGTSARNPADTAAYARIQALLGNSRDSLAVLGQAIEQQPKNDDLRLTLGEIALERKDFRSAEAEANEVLAREPGNQRAQALKRISSGRTSGASSRKWSDEAIEGAASTLDDPQVREAGRQATSRKNALRYLDRSMNSINIGDPREALRYLAFAEVNAPELPDVPMQQGLAHMALKEPGEARLRFEHAESIWTKQGNSQAVLAKKLKDRASAQTTSAALASKNEDTPIGLYADAARRRRWGHEKYPGEANSTQRHCVVSCLLAGTHAVAASRTAGFGNEVQGLLWHDAWQLPSRLTGKSPWAFSLKDLRDNERGFVCSKRTSTGNGERNEEYCDACCRSR